MDEKWPEIERRKEEQQNHDMLIQHGADILYIKETLNGFKGSLDGMVKTLVQDRKECWETCNGQLKKIEETAIVAKASIDEAKVSIKTLKAVGGVVAFALAVWAKFGGKM